MPESSEESNTLGENVPSAGRPSTTIQHSSTTSNKNRPANPKRNSTSASKKPPFSLKRAVTSLMIPDRKVGPAPRALASIRAIITASWLNVLLVFIPVSWALNFAMPASNSQKDTLVFVFSFLAIIPLAKLLAFATEELSMRVGQTLAGLLNATLGNAVELIVAIIALVKCDLRIVQSSLVGSILSNLLLVLGMCFFAGGVKFSEQGFGVSATQLNSSLLIISVIAVLLPAAFHFGVNGSVSAEGKDILAVSRGTALILLFIYGGYLFFQLYSHASLYLDDSEDVVKSTQYTKKTKAEPKSVTTGILINNQTATIPATGVERTVDVENNQLKTRSDVESGSQVSHDEEDEKPEMPQMSVLFTILLLGAVTVLVAVTAEWLVDSINGLTSKGTISQEFVGVILLPIVGNAAEHVTAVSVSVKDKLTLSLGVAVGSSIQIALFVIPFIITLAWILGKPLTLLFDPYESVALFLSVLTVNYVIQDGKSNWLEGLILMCLYLILALTFWFYPGSDPSGLLVKCQ